MPILIFIIAAVCGILLTVLTLKRAMIRGNLTHHRHALILAIGLGLTWTASFFAPFIPTNAKLNAQLVLFGFTHAGIIALVTYGLVRIMLSVRSNR